jgi:hypothetical protein
MAGLSGGYPTHGDTYRNSADDSTEVRWWAKGGTLVGESPARIAFFRSVMEQAPVHEMIPALVDNGNPSNLINNVHFFAREGEYYLAYVAEKGRKIQLTLPGDAAYKVEVIDTWNMQISPSEKIYTGEIEFEFPDKPYMALRITKQE